MNPSSQFLINPNTIFVIMALLIVGAMMMGKKNRTTHRTSYGWWIGLGVLLFIASGFIIFSRSGSGSNYEVRHSVKSAITQVKNQIRTTIENGRESLEEGLDELSKGMAQVEETVNSLGTSSSKTKGKKKPSSVAPTFSMVTTPASLVAWTVEVKENDRKQKKEEVDKLLFSKATSSVNRWVTERMPLKNLSLNVVTMPWLKERGAFPEPIDYQTQEVPRANTTDTDPLIGGTMKVVLTPEVQESLLEMGHQQLNALLKADQFQAQWIISLVLLGITLLVGIIGLVKAVAARKLPEVTAAP